MLRSIGYRGLPLDGVPFDERRGLIRNEAAGVGTTARRAGRVRASAGSSAGPSGVIGTNKKDAADTVARILEDAEEVAPGSPRARRRRAERWLAERAPDAVTWEGWQAIDEVERSAGEPQGRPRVKLVRLADLLEAGRATAAR